MIRRTCGTLTGSRSAVAAGRIPVESVACSLAPQWSQHGVQTASFTVMFASWVDNYYTFGASLLDAVQMAEVFEERLWQKWGLRIKPDSRSVMAPEAPLEGWDASKWPLTLEADVLGHILCANASRPAGVALKRVCGLLFGLTV